MYHGDIRLGDTIDIKFTTRQISGAPSTLAGSPVVSAYPGNSTTQLTAGITLTVDFDSVTGLNNVRVVASSGNGYATATNYTLVITTGTVNSVSVVGECIGSFSIENRSALMPATAGRTAVVDAAGLVDANVVKLGPTGSGTAQTARDIGASVLLSVGTGTGQVNLSSGNVPANTVQWAGNIVSLAHLGIVDAGTAQAVSATQLQLRAAANFGANDVAGGTLLVSAANGAGNGQARVAISNTAGAGGNIVVEGWSTTPVSPTYVLFGTPPSTTSSLDAVADKVWDEALSGHTTAGTAGKALSDAGTGADPWATNLPGSYTGNQAGSMLSGMNVTLASANTTINTANTHAANANTHASNANTNIIAGNTAVMTRIGANGAALTAIPNLDVMLSTRSSEANMTTARNGIVAIDSNVVVVLGQTNKLTFDGGNRVAGNTTALAGNVTAASNLQAGALGLVSSTCAAGSTTTSIVTNLTEATDDHYNGRVITFTGGALAGQSTSISDYNGTTKTLTVVALTEAPANTDPFVIS